MGYHVKGIFSEYWVHGIVRFFVRMREEKMFNMFEFFRENKITWLLVNNSTETANATVWITPSANKIQI